MSVYRVMLLSQLIVLPADLLMNAHEERLHYLLVTVEAVSAEADTQGISATRTQWWRENLLLWR